MQGLALHQGGNTPPPEPPARIWLIAGTGEGPPLAACWLARGWSVRVSVVSAAAARAYAPHPRLELRIGAIGGEAGPGPAGSDPGRAVLAELHAAELRGRPFRWVIDASHPFAQRISATLAIACTAADQPLLRLERPLPPRPEATILADLPSLAGIDLIGRRLLLENPATYVVFKESTIPESAFLAEVVRRTGCGLLLDINNLFVSDGSLFTTSACANPTLTIISLMLRQADYLAGQLTSGAL